MKSTTKPLPNYTFGVEIETFGVHGAVLAWGLREAGLVVSGRHANDDGTPARQADRTNGAWDLGDDGSIRGKHPIEIRSPILSGRKGLEEIMKVCKVLNKLGSEVNTSTGLHVHVGILNAEKQGEKPFNVHEIVSILKRYRTWEKSIDGFLAAGRRAGKNTYCNSIDRVLTSIEAEVAKAGVPTPPVKTVDAAWGPLNALNVRGCDCSDCVISAVTAENRRLLDEHNAKYQRRINLANLTTLAQFADHYDKVSVQPLTKYGTIEFRQHHGTVDGKEICNWVRFLLNHIQVSRRLAVDPAVAPVVAEAVVGQSGVVEAPAKAPKAPKDRGELMGLQTHVKKHFKGQAARFSPRPRRKKAEPVTVSGVTEAP